MRIILSFFAAIFLVTTQQALADPLPVPTGDVILTVSGDLAMTNTGRDARFDLEMLRALPTEAFSTTTIWTEGEQAFVGVPLKTLLDRLDVEGTVIRASAINDYTVEIPRDSLGDAAPVVAYLLDGETLSRRQKGPLWIVYPFDSDPAFRTEVIYSRSIWQLDRLDIVQ